MGRKSKRKQAAKAAKIALSANISLTALPYSGGMVIPALTLDAEVAERAKTLLSAAGYSDEQAAMFVMGVIAQKRALVEKVFSELRH